MTRNFRTLDGARTTGTVAPMLAPEDALVLRTGKYMCGGREARIISRATPYFLPALLMLAITLGLIADKILGSYQGQIFLGVVCIAILAVGAKSAPPKRQRQIALLVVVSIPIEIFGSILWGTYRYRFGNVPFYVPPGHGIVYLFSLQLAATPLAMRYARAFCGAAALLATIWMLAGVSIIPMLGGRMDVFGAMCWPIFVFFIITNGKRTLFAGAFFATSFVEVLGTGLQDWQWAATTPVIHIATGSPPSVAAGLYCLLDALALLCNRGMQRAVIRGSMWRKRNYSQSA